MKHTPAHNNTHYDVIVIGAGVSGAAQLYALAKYTDVARIALIEKEHAPGLINSHPNNNAQTLHEGDIETNYTKEKAALVKGKAGVTRTYLEAKNDPQLFLRSPKMVLGVGAKEVAFLEARYESFKDLYPTLSPLHGNQLREQEPAIMAGRPIDEPVLALHNPDGITVDYAALADSLIADAVAHVANDPERTLDIFYETKVATVKQRGEGYMLTTTGGTTLETDFLSVAAGAHSMYLAKKMKLPEAKHLSLLGVAGNFYYTKKKLDAKVYTVQNPALPFSAVHGDPDIQNEFKTRYGPTTRLVFMLERRKWNTITEFFTTLNPLLRSFVSYLRVLGKPTFFWYAVKHNVLFPLPILGRYLFTREIRKIIPEVKFSEVSTARGQGGIRPQIVNTGSTKPLELGEAKLEAKNALFNVTPSPGATTALYNGLVDVSKIAETLGATYHHDAVKNDFGIVV